MIKYGISIIRCSFLNDYCSNNMRKLMYESKETNGGRLLQHEVNYLKDLNWKTGLINCIDGVNITQNSKHRRTDNLTLSTATTVTGFERNPGEKK